MSDKFYGLSSDSQESSESKSTQYQDVMDQGFTIIENVLSSDELDNAAEKIDQLYGQQKGEFGEENLQKINELNLLRCPMAYDDAFLNYCTKHEISSVLAELLGGYYIINQQNAIINKPEKEHHQRTWHRDLPYQDYVVSKPIAVSCMLCINDFTEETGGTVVLPESHKSELAPTPGQIEKDSVVVVAPRGSVVLFNSQLFHKAGTNISDQIRRGLNTMFTVPIIKQQINLYTALEGRHSDDIEKRRLLGYDLQVPETVNDWRTNRLNRS